MYTINFKGAEFINVFNAWFNPSKDEDFNIFRISIADRVLDVVEEHAVKPTDGAVVDTLSKVIIDSKLKQLFREVVIENDFDRVEATVVWLRYFRQYCISNEEVNWPITIVGWDYEKQLIPFETYIDEDSTKDEILSNLIAERAEMMLAEFEESLD
jgi:hypothetical protein